jgi:nucleotide-binding universal stress UspA family protein
MYRTALVALKPAASNEALETQALHLATTQNLKLTGVAILDADQIAPAEAVPIGGSVYKQQRDAALIARAREAITAAVATFQKRCGEAHVSASVISVESHLEQEINTLVQRFDLLMVGRSTTDDDSTLHNLLKHCPRPALVVPAVAEASRSAVVIAYDGSDQAARAIEAFVHSGFGEGSPVHVVTIGDDPADAAAIADSAATYLKCHDFEVNVHLGDGSMPAAEWILQAVKQHSAKLLVMGAYGTRTIQEFFFGSVTSRILGHIEIPVLVDH